MNKPHQAKNEREPESVPEFFQRSHWFVLFGKGLAYLEHDYSTKQAVENENGQANRPGWNEGF
jgi:hypothetical protein